MIKKVLFIAFFILTFIISSNSQKKFPEERAKPKYALFYDNHTNPNNPDVGKNLDVEAFTDRIKDCGVDYITFAAKCNQGMAYYETEFGIKHPSLKRDLFGELADACKRKDISLVAYLQGGLSNAEGVKHRDWTTIRFDGRELGEGRTSPYVRTMCYNSGFRDNLISMIKEITEKYPVSGFFIDGMGASFDCICPICIKEMKEKGIDWTNKNEVLKFGEFSALRFSKDMYDTIMKINPNLTFYSNVADFEKQYDFSTHYEVETLPYGPRGYDYLPVMAHYVRTLGDRTVLNMPARFSRWGDFGGLRPEETMKYELLYGFANGLRPNIGDHFHPRGDVNHAVFDRIQKIYNELQTMEPWYDNAKNITEVAIVFPRNFSTIRSDEALKSAVRMLDELKLQFDIVTTFTDWDKYDILVLPDGITLDEEIANRVKIHLDNGKSIISTGSSGLNPDRSKFVFENEWGVKFLQNNEYNPAFVSVGDNLKYNLPDMPLSLYSSGIDLKVLEGTNVEANIVKPYYNAGWDGLVPFYYLPPDEVTDLPAITMNKQVAHFSHSIFSGYAREASVDLRIIFSNVINSYLQEPIFKHENLPSFARAFVTEQPGRRMVHLISYIPEMRTSITQLIEEPIKLNNVKIALRSDVNTPEKVYLAPEKKSLPFKVVNGYIEVTVPECNGYSLVVFE